MSGFDGGGNQVHQTYQVQSTPTVIVITPDRYIFNQHVWLPTQDNITAAVVEAGGMLVGLDEQTQKSLDHRLMVYPNPMGNRAKISFEIAQKSEYHIEIISLSGRIVYTSLPRTLEVGEQEINLNPGDIEKGVYFVRLMRNNEILESIKVVSL